VRNGRVDYRLIFQRAKSQKHEDVSKGLRVQFGIYEGLNKNCMATYHGRFSVLLAKNARVLQLEKKSAVYKKFSFVMRHGAYSTIIN
jgi:hypothetical protein